MLGPRCLRPVDPADTLHCGIPIVIKGTARNVWIDHDAFSRCGQECIAVGTESAHLPPGVQAPAGDLVTISNSRFEHAYYAVVINAQAGLADDQLPAHERVTLYGNVFNDIFRRSPRAASHALVHLFNNLIENWGNGLPCAAAGGTGYGWGVSSIGEAELLVENNVFVARPQAEACKVVAQIGRYQPRIGYQRGIGKLRTSGNLLENGAVLTESSLRVRSE